MQPCWKDTKDRLYLRRWIHPTPRGEWGHGRCRRPTSWPYCYSTTRSTRAGSVWPIVRISGRTAARPPASLRARPKAL